MNIKYIYILIFILQMKINIFISFLIIIIYYKLNIIYK